MAIIKNAIQAMENQMSPEQVRRARLQAEKDIFAIRLADLRQRMQVKQCDVPAFTQTAVSKLEKRKDMKLSTLIEYLEGIGMGLEIKVYPKQGNKKGQEETLLRV